MRVTVTFDKNLKKKLEGFTVKGQEVLDSEVLKSSNVYVPMDEGELMRSSLRHTEFGTGKIVWDMPYARKLYYNPQYNFSKDTNPQAQGLWFEAAKAADKDKWIAIINNLKKNMI